MKRYITTAKVRYIKGVGTTAKWHDTYTTRKLYAPPDYKERIEEEIVFEDEEHFIRYFYEENLKPLDFDVCGTEEHFFRFDTGRIFRLEHSWWRNYDYDSLDEYSDPFDYEHYITDVTNTVDLPRVIMIEDRDWL